MKKLVALFAVSLSLFAVACGGGAEEAKAPEGGSAAPAGDTAAPPAGDTTTPPAGAAPADPAAAPPAAPPAADAPKK